MTQNDIQFDLNKALEDLKAGKPMHGDDGFLTPLIKQLTEAALQAEQEQHYFLTRPATHKIQW